MLRFVVPTLLLFATAAAQPVQSEPEPTSSELVRQLTISKAN